MNRTEIILLSLLLKVFIVVIYVAWHLNHADRDDKKTKKTNGDLIRYSDNKVLALWLECPVHTGLAEIACDRSAIPYIEKDCYGCKINWLNREVEETE